MTKAEEIGHKYGIIDGCTLHSNLSIAKRNFNSAMNEYAEYVILEYWKYVANNDDISMTGLQNWLQQFKVKEK